MRDSKVKNNGVVTSRRSFVVSVGGAAVTVFGLSPAASRAETLPKVDESDPMAIALKYVHDATTVADSVRTRKDSFCNNCALYAGSASDEWAGCSVFPGKSVAGRGWCSVWALAQNS